MKRQVAHIQDLEMRPPYEEREIEVTLVDNEQPAHLWPKEKLRVIRMARNLGGTAMVLTAVRHNPGEDDSSMVEIYHTKERMDMVDVEPEPEKKSILDRLRRR